MQLSEHAALAIPDCWFRAFGGELLHLYDGHDVVNTSADVPSGILRIVLYGDRRVLHYGCSFEHIPVCLGKTVLQGALSLWCPKFNLFGDRVCLFESLSVGWVQEQRDVVWEWTVFMNSPYIPTPRVVHKHTHVSTFALPERAVVRSPRCTECVCNWTANCGTSSESHFSVKTRAQDSLISCWVVILALSSSSMFSTNRTLTSRRPGGRLARAFSLAWSPPLLPHLRRCLRSAVLGSACSVGLGASCPSRGWWLRVRTMSCSSKNMKPVNWELLLEVAMSNSVCPL